MPDKIKKPLLREIEAAFEPHPTCRLITPYTRYKGISDKVLERLQAVRELDIENDEIGFDLGPLMRTEIGGKPLSIRKYQYQQIAHFISMPRQISGLAVGLGKTICAIGASAYLKNKNPDLKVIILTTRSTARQWVSEIEKFSHLRTWGLKDTYKDLKGSEARLLQIKHFLHGTKKDVLVAKYTSLVGKRRKLEGVEFDENGNPLDVKGKETVSREIVKLKEILESVDSKNILLILDEGHKFANEGTSIRSLVENCQSSCGRVITMTATGIKNKLTELNGIAYAIGIRPFGPEFNFKVRFCIMKTKHIGKGRKVREVTGYKNVAAFRDALRPWFFGRSQAQVKEKLPKLTTVMHRFQLSEKEHKLLTKDIPNGDYQLPPSFKKVAGEIYEIERDTDNMMTMLSIYQIVANSYLLLDKDNPSKFLSKTLSSKEEELLDLLDGDLADEKVIVFTKYRTWIDRLEWLTNNGHFTNRKFLRITGAEDEVEREVNRRLFQEDPEHNLIIINSAAIEGVNLQSAAHMIVLDAPFGFGSFLQLVGRMVRMASPNSACTLHMLIAEGTIDEYILEILKSKKKIFEKILGESYSAGILDDGSDLDLESGMDDNKDAADFMDLLKVHIKKVKIMDYLSGKELDNVKSKSRNREQISDEDVFNNLWQSSKSKDAMLSKVLENEEQDLED